MKAPKLSFFLSGFVLQFIAVYCASDDLLDSWKKINTNYANDIQQAYKIYSKIKEEQRALAELNIIVGRHLRTKNAELLVNTLSSGTNLTEILNKFNENYDSQMIDSIFAEAIEEIILSSEITQLPDLLWHIYQKNDKKSFVIMLHAQLELFKSVGLKQYIDDEFLQLFANKLYHIKQDTLYNNVDLSLKLKIQRIVDQLPNSLKYLYFMPYFCLQNIKYSTYIYTAIEAKVDPLSRYIWLWRDNRSMDDTGYIKAEIGELNANNEKKLKVILKGTKYQMFYYMMPDTMKVAGWEGTTDTPLNYIWNIEFGDNDHVVVSQSEYLMCAVESHDSDRRNVGGRKRGEVSSLSPECQWRLGQCIFK